MNDQPILQDLPRPIIACICSDFQTVDGGGGYNIIRIFDSISLQRPPNLPAEVPIPFVVKAVTCWTEGIGNHTHQLRLLDEDRRPLVEAPVVPFSLVNFAARHWMLDQIVIPLTRSTQFTVEVRLDQQDDPAVHYVFPVTLV